MYAETSDDVMEVFQKVFGILGYQQCSSEAELIIFSHQENGEGQESIKQKVLTIDCIGSSGQGSMYSDMWSPGLPSLLLSPSSCMIRSIVLVGLHEVLD